MKIKLNQKIMNAEWDKPMKNLDKPVLDEKNKPTGEHEDLTLRAVCIAACYLPINGEKFNEKMARWELYKKFLRAKRKTEIELSSEEVTALKKHIGDIQPSPLVLGQAAEMLEGKTLDSEEKNE